MTIPSSAKAISGDLPVPATSIYSRTDGIVNWRTCLLRPSDTAENIEVHLASHIGLGVNAAALWAIADRLAQTEGNSANLTGQDRLPLHMRLRKMHNPEVLTQDRLTQRRRQGAA